ncbi:hypothetical protein F5B19DRAFT_490950 [Rostrohypoxylon terebratum]|nr:hypothetical protein F5B19DRAFT_490950 [Rostrohypoxylon terebratum]
MGSFTLKTLLSVAATAAQGLAFPAADAPTPVATATASALASACTAGSPVVTAGYTINYAPAVPTGFQNGYQPAEAWAAAHSKASYTFGAPDPIETGFAYSQFKCQYYCNNVPSGSFFVDYKDNKTGALCTCFDEVMDPQSFIANEQPLVGAWNNICK